MSDGERTAIGFWRTVDLLLRTARQRSRARHRRQQALLRSRKASGTGAMNAFALVGAFLFGAAGNVMFCIGLHDVVRLVEYRAAERDGRMLVTERFMTDAFGSAAARERAVRTEAWRRQRVFGGEVADNEPTLRRQLDARGRSGFVVHGSGADDDGLASIATATPLASKAALTIIALWFLMLAFQGEGLELDVQRRRYPMWEWLFSHPIRPGAAFLAEMLTPLASNPVYAAAPIFWCGALGFVHGAAGLVAGVIVGGAMAVAASCFSKAIEIAAMLRLSPRSRGAVLSIMSWLGYSMLMLGLFAGPQRGVLVALASGVDRIAAIIPLAPARWMLGVNGDGNLSLTLAVMTCLALSAAVVVGSVWSSSRATAVGIAGGFADASRAPRARGSLRWHPVRDALLRKELLWFSRDRGAVVQAVLIPLTIGAMQAFNLRSIAKQAGESWNWFCGLGVLAGTYFLLVLGPRSLMSEGGALWIALTWPRGLEPLLKAKARLWWVIGSVVVLAVIVFALARFPGNAAEIALVAAGWMVFGRSLAEKTVTLVVAPSSSGEPEPVPKGRQFAATLGAFSFASGVIARNWHLAALGVMFSTLTAAAMWQNFRERLPYLFDPDSERLPPAPSLMHAMVAITAMVDGMGIVSIPIVLMVNVEGIWAAQVVAYGVAALVTWVVMNQFLEGRGVTSREIWDWPANARSSGAAFATRFPRLASPGVALTVGVGLGVALGVFGLGYRWCLWHVPRIAEDLASMAKYLAEHPDRKWGLLLVAVAFAPIAEEYLFRGLLFRALDREWGGWRAVVGSAIFFGVYHPPLSWIPVGLAGVVLALLFKTSGRLWPCVIVHAVYNAMVIVTL